MELIKVVISEQGLTILGYLLAILFGQIGMFVKKLYTKYFDSQTKKDVAKTCVQAVEQIYKDIHGEEKLQKALDSASNLLAKKGITFDADEMMILIEAALAEFNEAFSAE